MELPFLKPKKMASIILMSKKSADKPAEPISEEGESSAELMQASERLIKAVIDKDTKAVASALSEAFMSMEKAEESQDK